MTELVAAAQHANLSVVRRLLKRGDDASSMDFSNGETALHAVSSLLSFVWAEDQSFAWWW